MSTFRIRKDKDNPYVMLNKEFLDDSNLSWKSKGLLAYLLSLPDDWQIYESEIVNHAKDGKDSLKSAIKELIQLGYIERTRERDEKGMLKGYNYSVYERPIQSGKSNVGKSNVGKPATTNNNLTNNDNNIINKLETTKEQLETILNKYNSITELPKCIKLTDKRKKGINARIKEYDIETILKALDKVKESNFLKGLDNRDFKANIDWIFNPNNFIKILEDKYKNRTIEKKETNTDPTNDFFNLLG